jgi:hypothetical protein
MLHCLLFVGEDKYSLCICWLLPDELIPSLHSFLGGFDATSSLFERGTDEISSSIWAR